MTPKVILLAAALLSLTVAVAAEEELPRKTLAECLEIALQRQPTLAAAGASVQAANQRVWQAASGYLPQIFGNYDANRRQTSATAQTGASGLGTVSQTFNFYSTGVAFSQVLFDFGKTLALIRAAQDNERSAQANYVTQREVVVLNVKQSYFNVIAARRLLEVAEETLRDTQKQLEQAQGRHDVGLAPRFDVTTAEVQVANAELNLVTARNNLDVARVTLRNAMGLTGPVDFDVVDALQQRPINTNEQQALDTAYASRPELQSLEAQKASQEQQIASLQRDYLPSVGGTGSYNWTGTNYPLGSNWNVGASVTVSVFNGGLTTAQIGEAKANLANLEYTEDSTRQNIALEVRQALLTVRRAWESIRVSEKGLQSARESLALAEGRYNTGVGNIIELTDAQASLTTAEANLVQAVVGYQVAIAALERAIGRPIGPRGEIG